MLISREPDQEKGIDEKRGFFATFWPSPNGLIHISLTQHFTLTTILIKGCMKWTSLLL